MELVIVISILIAVVSVFVSCLTIRRVKRQISEMTDALADIKNGNGNRRILSAANELVAPIAYEINEITSCLLSAKYTDTYLSSLSGVIYLFMSYKSMKN